MKLLLPMLLPAAATLVACTQERPLPGPPPAERCDAAPVARLVGRDVTARLQRQAQRRSGARIVRVLAPGTVVTMEYRAGRLNLNTDARNRLVSANCG